MDTELARTFLAIVASGSFVGASERLHVAQTTVSARIRSLEEQLRRPLFVRNKAGAVLTSAGEQFLRHAPQMIQLWERARHEVAVPPGRRAMLAVGGELSLWEPFLREWLLWMRRSAPDVALRVSVGLADDLANQVAGGILDLAVVYAPRYRAGLKIELVAEERLVLVRTPGRGAKSDDDNYVYVDWGPEFAVRHGMAFPDRAEPGLHVGLGPLALTYILQAGGSGYFRLGAVRSFLADGQLKLVRGAPEFIYPAYAVYAESGGDRDLMETAFAGLRHAALLSQAGAPQTGEPSKTRETRSPRPKASKAGARRAKRRQSA
ncbi:LysR family transcriptional regulator [Sabulicella glaciei]|uniref:LysR family transcriptional regulator n=1 Tax=Sabulicella glaciei TaxID=2984948 RepID=A0ABT3P0A4_9PROT|nr:LysR family transcriptional regulator [Roseococcus sp. MDT2-1-1]MCW8087847.1 LysR family transcriptional regulator [Roseococcus sp. MDT2-1-1]